MCESIGNTDGESLSSPIDLSLFNSRQRAHINPTPHPTLSRSTNMDSDNYSARREQNIGQSKECDQQSRSRSASSGQLNSGAISGRGARGGSSQSMAALAMANPGHLLSALSRQSRLALVQAKLLTVPTIILISLFAFVISASTGTSAAWQTLSHHSAREPNLAAARQALELRLLQAEAADSQTPSQQQQQQPLDDNRDELIRQLISARKLLDERIASKLSSSLPQQSDQLVDLIQLDNSGGAQNNAPNHYYRLVDSDTANDQSEPTGDFDDDDDDERARSQLAELLLRQQEESLANDNSNADDEFNTRSSSFSSPYLKLPSASPVVLNGAAAVGDLASAPNSQSEQFAAADKRQSKSDDHAAKYTTLLEDEANSTATTTSPVEPTTAVSYGKLIKSTESGDQRTGNNTKQSQPQSASSVFSRLLDRLASYVPFLNQHGAAGGKANMTNNKKEADEVVSSQDKSSKIQVDLNVNRQQQPATAEEGADARQRVSTSQASSSTRQPQAAAGIGNDKTTTRQSSEAPKTQQAKDDNHETNDNKSEEKKLVKVRVSQVDTAATGGGDDATDSFASLGTFANNRDDNNNRVFVNTNMKRVAFNAEGVAGVAEGSAGLVLPPVFAPATAFEGKYIYAPEQHYYIGPDGRATASAATTTSLFAAGPPTHSAVHHPAMLMKHHQVFHPNEHIFATYEPLKPGYAYGKGGMEGILLGGNKSPAAGSTTPNDLYFLVMVGAFCVMAMAVVLAAGLFAYRVQQNRKSSQDTDYPTYGVVGPNNMNGKCGAAAFVGGYLGNNIVGSGGPGSSGSFGSQKSGCSAGAMKHLPSDLYASDSGLASTDKGSSKKASLASASSDNNTQKEQQQQAASHRGNSTNFMMANQDAARMYHYQHQKQQMIISDRSSAGRHTSASDLDSDEENEDGSYTVYECPGLASAHEMEIKNPLFNDDQTP